MLGATSLYMSSVVTNFAHFSTDLHSFKHVIPMSSVLLNTWAIVSLPLGLGSNHSSKWDAVVTPILVNRAVFSAS